MELTLALLLAASLVALASTWNALRTERDLASRERTPAPRGPADLPPQAGRDEGTDAASVERVTGGEAPLALPQPPAPAPAAAFPAGSYDRFAATLVAPAERLAESIDACGPVLEAAAGRLRAPMPAAAPAPGIDELAAPGPGTESVERAIVTAERISDERARLADDVRSLRSVLERVAALDGGVSRALGEVSRTSDGLLPLASSVSGLADRANLLGLNVSLLAARAGDAGAPFEEAAVELRGVFEEARRLSRELSEAARRTEAGARKVATFVKESGEAASSGQERGARAAERLGALDGLCGQLDRALGEAVRSARSAAEAQSLFLARLEAARSSLEARAAENARLRADAEAAREALRAAAERIEALRLDGGALRAAVARVTSGA